MRLWRSAQWPVYRNCNGRLYSKDCCLQATNKKAGSLIPADLIFFIEYLLKTPKKIRQIYTVLIIKQPLNPSIWTAFFWLPCCCQPPFVTRKRNQTYLLQLISPSM